MRKNLLKLLSPLFLALVCALSAQAATYGTTVTVTSDTPEGGLVCATHATTTYFFAYTHKKPADPADSEYAATKTISWESSGGGTKCEVKFYLYAKALPGYQFVEWRQGTSTISTEPQHTITANHYTQTPNHNGYSYTAIFKSLNCIESQTVADMNGNTLSGFATISVTPETPQIGETFTATATINTINYSGQKKYPNMMAEFDHWEINGAPVSAEAELTYTPTENVNLKAVYRSKGEKPQVGKYYRIKNASNRVMGLSGKYSISISGGKDIDQSLMRFYKDVNNDDSLYPMPGENSQYSDSDPIIPESAPGTIFYIPEGTNSGNDLDKVYLTSQGVNSKDFVSQSLCITPMSTNMFGYYGMCASSAKSAGFKMITRETGDILNVSSFSNVDPFAAFAFQPIDQEHIDTYWFGVDAASDMEFDSGYWASMYTEFPYQLQDGVEAYYLTAEGIGTSHGEKYAVLTQIESDYIPAGSAVILKCTTPDDTKANRLLPIAPNAQITYPSLEGNLLRGVCQLYTDVNKNGRVHFDESTMRIFGVNADKKVGFFKLAGSPELLANRAYLDMSQLPAGAKAVSFRLTTKNDSSGIEAIEEDGAAIKFEDSKIFDLQGRPVASPEKGNLYIIDGRKARF